MLESQVEALERQLREKNEALQSIIAFVIDNIPNRATLATFKWLFATTIVK